MVSLSSSSPLLGAGHLEPTPRKRNVLKMNRVTAALHNRETVVYLISTMGALSQLQIARLTQLQPSTVSYIVRELKARGLVREGKAVPSERVGPKETLIEMNPTAAWSVGLTLDALGNKLCLMNAAGHIICQRTFSPESNTPGFLDSMPSHLAELIGQYRLEMDETTVTTVSVPGVVNTATGCVLNSMSLHLENYPLAEQLTKSLQHPVIVARNTACGAYAERYLGLARASDHFLYFLARPQIHPDSGERYYSFGLSMVMNGEIYHGFNSAAGEMHDGNLLQPYQNERGFFPSGKLLEQKHAATAFLPLGRALASLVDLLDPEILIICSDEQLLTNENLQILKTTIQESLIPVPGRKLEITRSLLGIDGTLYGASLMGLHRGLKRRLEASAPEV
jgi:predicted NBD/HSP70 family sugar kinase